MASFLQNVRERVVIYDGAMGTNIQVRQPSPDDFWGKEGCNEILVLSRPDIIRDIHDSFLAVGCDVGRDQYIRRNAHRARRIGPARQGRGDQSHGGEDCARSGDRFSTNGRPRFVVGSIGPTTKLPSLGHIEFDELAGRLRRAGAGCWSKAALM